MNQLTPWPHATINNSTILPFDLILEASHVSGRIRSVDNFSPFRFNGWNIKHGGRAYLGSQQSSQIDLRDHLAATVSLLLVSMLMVLHQMPHFDTALLVRCDHWCAGTQAVRTARVLDHVFCWSEKDKDPSDGGSSSIFLCCQMSHAAVQICSIAFCCAVLEIGYESFRTYGCLIFYSCSPAHFLSGERARSLTLADIKSNRCQARWNIHASANRERSAMTF